jgi:putative peptide zinc metalloprotease protein
VPQQQLVLLQQPAVATLPAPALLIAQSVPVLDEVTPISELAATKIEDPSGPVSESVDPATSCAQEWPFPFDPPENPEADDNRAVACNTTDGTLLSDVAVSLLLATAGEPIDQSNEAHAYASCTGCQTIAVAFQVILIVGYSDEFTPVNGAVAANFECKRCDSEAFAYQLVMTLAGMPSDRVLEDIARILREVEGLDLASMSEEDIYLALENAKQDILETLGDDLMLGLDNSTATSSSKSPPTTRDGTGQQPAEETDAYADGSGNPATEDEYATPETTTETTTTTTTTPDDTTTTTDSTTTEETGDTTTDPSTDEDSTGDTTTTESTDTSTTDPSADTTTTESTDDSSTTDPSVDD